MMCICMTRVVRCEVGGGSGHTGARAADATAAVNSSLSQEGGLMD